MKNGVNIDALPPGFYWINGYNKEHTGMLPFTDLHYFVLCRGTGKLCDTQIAFPNKSEMIKVRHRDNTSSAWGTWVDQINLPSFSYGFIADLNEFKQFSSSPKIMFGNGTGYNNYTKNSPANGAFCALYIPYGGNNYGVQLVFAVQRSNGVYQMWKRVYENNTWDAWIDVANPAIYGFDGTGNWDSCIAPGVYTISFLSGSNAPTDIGQWGYLEVVPWEDGTQGCLQRYYSTAGTVAFRVKYDGRWNPWSKLA